MSFFKDYQEDFSEALGDLLPDEDALEALDGETTEDEAQIGDAAEESVPKNSDEGETDTIDLAAAVEALNEDIPMDMDQAIAEDMKADEEETAQDTSLGETSDVVFEDVITNEEEPVMDEPVVGTDEAKEAVKYEPQTPIDVEGIFGSSDETDEAEMAVITKGMTITGDLESIGSVEIRGVINGNVKTNGKLMISGKIRGNSNSKEFFADSARVDGEINSDGSVKIGNGSVIVGNIVASSAVIAGAVKGDLDVRGPVIVDTTAIIVGNIKSKSVQINNGAVIEGFCSQAYADVDVDELFGKISEA